MRVAFPESHLTRPTAPHLEEMATSFLVCGEVEDVLAAPCVTPAADRRDSAVEILAEVPRRAALRRDDAQVRVVQPVEPAVAGNERDALAVRRPLRQRVD